MKRFFKYRTVEDLAEDIERLGLSEDIKLSENFEALLHPVKVAGREVKNALVIHPMEGCDGTHDGKPDLLTYRRYERFGSGGAGIIWFEATAVVPEGRANKRQLLLCEANAKHFEVLVNLARRAHKAVYGSDDGLLCGIQLTHSGRYSFMKPIIAFHHPILDARAGISDDYPVCTDDYLERLEDEFVKAAKLAMKVGFDFIDIKQCHGYLLCELLSAKSRQGKYGGSFENRTRFIRNTIGKIKSELGERILIATRMSVYDGVPFELDKSTGVGKPSQYPLPYIYGFGCAEDDPMSIDMSEPIKLAELLSSLGVRIINVTMGNPYTNPHIGRPFERPPIDGYETPEHPLVGVARLLRGAREIQTAVKDVPVVATGLSWLRQFWAHTAVGMITNGYCKLVGLGRMALAYPDFAYDMIKFGTVDENKTCLADSHCTALMRFKHNELCQFPVGCPTRDPLYKPIYHHAVKTLP
jgi:2,4-dienoyl-CoA reductase-like NADH-dependent reductase (Old Yellow Enzyme family)